MKFDTLVLIVFGLLVGFLLFSGVIKALQSSFKSVPKPQNDEMHRLNDQQKEKMRDIEIQRRRLMEDRQQRLRDAQRMRR